MKIWGWDPFLSYVKNRYIFEKLKIELVPLAVKSSWAVGDWGSFVSIFCAYFLGFAAEL